MSSNEWPLIFFTLFSQTAVGLVIAIAISGFWNRGVRFSFPAIPLSALLMVIALLISFFHLGSPVKAVYAMGNLQSSWLSREILSASLFCGLLVIWSVSLMPARQYAIIDGSMRLVSALAGIAMIYTMGRLYMIPTVPAWNTGSVLISFYTSALITGPALLLVIASLNKDYAIAGNKKFLSLIVMLPVVSVIVRLADRLWPYIPTEIPVFAPAPVSGLIEYIHLFMILAGIALLVHEYLLFKRHRYIRTGSLLLAFSLLFIAEISARFLFYSGYWRLGV
jgi:anaerobic dimethyl sulfoxide reductase subunit C